MNRLHFSKPYPHRSISPLFDLRCPPCRPPPPYRPARKAELSSRLAASEAEVHDLTSRISRDEERAGGAQREAGKLAKRIQEAHKGLEEVRAGALGSLCLGRGYPGRWHLL